MWQPRNGIVAIFGQHNYITHSKTTKLYNKVRRLSLGEKVMKSEMVEKVSRQGLIAGIKVILNFNQLEIIVDNVKYSWLLASATADILYIDISVCKITKFIFTHVLKYCDRHLDTLERIFPVA